MLTDDTLSRGPRQSADFRPPGSQVPLLPAWAITVHKSQGMTLSRVEVDLTRSFEREMMYVALSRAQTLH